MLEQRGVRTEPSTKRGDVGQELDGENDGGDGAVDGLTARGDLARDGVR